MQIRSSASWNERSSVSYFVQKFVRPCSFRTKKNHTLIDPPLRFPQLSCTEVAYWAPCSFHPWRYGWQQWKAPWHTYCIWPLSSLVNLPKISCLYTLLSFWISWVCDLIPQSRGKVQINKFSCHMISHVVSGCPTSVAFLIFR
jgi:hypothetical protein